MNPVSKLLSYLMTSLLLVLAAGTVTPVISGVYLDNEAPWPRKHHDHRNTGQSPYPGPVIPQLGGGDLPVS